MRDDRVTDHRIAASVYGVRRVLAGARELDELIDAVQTEARYERLRDQLQQQPDTSSPAVSQTSTS